MPHGAMQDRYTLPHPLQSQPATHRVHDDAPPKNPVAVPEKFLKVSLARMATCLADTWNTKMHLWRWNTILENRLPKTMSSEEMRAHVSKKSLRQMIPEDNSLCR